MTDTDDIKLTNDRSRDDIKLTDDRCRDDTGTEHVRYPGTKTVPRGYSSEIWNILIVL